MSLAERIESDVVQAMKSKDADKVSTLRMIKAAMTNHQIEKNTNTIKDEEVVSILQKQAKQRRESIESYEKAGRKELAAKEAKELDILSAYLPKQLTDEEITILAQKAVAESGAKAKADAGPVMKLLMPAVKGKADGKKVNQIVMGLLS